MVYPTFVAGWYRGEDYEHKTTPCNYNESLHCRADKEMRRHKKCRGCRTRIYCARACGPRLHYTPSARGNPCVASAWQIHAKSTGGDSGFMCVHPDSVLNDAVLRNLSRHGVAKTAGTDGRSLYDQLLVGHFKPNRKNWDARGRGYCENFNHLDRVINANGETCYKYLARRVSQVSAKQKAAQYCESRLPAIKSELCTPENLGKTKHDALAAKFCESPEGKGDDWCACYNAFTGKCKEENWAEYAGCEGVKVDHKKLIGDIPEDQLSGSVRQQLGDRMHCRNNVCKVTSNRFKPDGADKCDLNLNLCIQDVNIAGHLVDSGVSLTCNNTMNTGGESSSDKAVEEAERAEEEKSSKRKKAAIFGFSGVTSSSMCCCCVIIIIVVILMSGGNKKPPNTPPSMMNNRVPMGG